MLGVLVTDTEGGTLIEGVALRLIEGVLDIDTDGVTDALGVTDIEGVTDTLGVIDMEGVTETDGVTEIEGVTDMLGVTEGVIDIDGVIETPIVLVPGSIKCTLAP